MALKWMYQQDKASSHVSQESREWFSEKGIRVMYWPGRFTDPNRVENGYNWLLRKFCDDAGQFGLFDELANCMKQC